MTGSLLLRLETPPGQFVSPGTGRLALTGSGSSEIVAQQAARAAGAPVLPGSGIKGAVRTLYELLSFSCNPFDRGSPCKPNFCCDACSLFGRLSRTGRVTFGDAVAAGPGAVRTEVQKVPVPWEPDGSQTRGEFRLYDLAKATELDPVRKIWVERSKDLAREVYTGRFETRLTFWNASQEELGRLLLAMGLGPQGTPLFYLRLGGVKYDGKGAVRVTPLSLRLATSDRRTLQGEPCLRECAGWINAARSSSWAGTFWPKLEELAKTLGPVS